MVYIPETSGYSHETRAYSTGRGKTYRESDFWGWVQVDGAIPYYGLGILELDRQLKADWQRVTSNWIRRVIRQMQKEKFYQNYGIPGEWHQETQVDDAVVRGSLYNSSPFFKYIENPTAGAPRRFPPWKPGSRLWDWAERRGLLSFTTKRQIQQRVVFGIAKAVYEHGTEGKNRTHQVVEDRLPELRDDLITVLENFINGL